MNLNDNAPVFVCLPHHLSVRLFILFLQFRLMGVGGWDDERGRG